MHPFDALATLLCPILIVVTLCYLGACVGSPYGKCRRCQGAGSTPAMFGRRRPCHRCQTTGIRLRIGRDATKGQPANRQRTRR